MRLQMAKHAVSMIEVDIRFFGEGLEGWATMGGLQIMEGTLQRDSCRILYYPSLSYMILYHRVLFYIILYIVIDYLIFQYIILYDIVFSYIVSYILSYESI